MNYKNIEENPAFKAGKEHGRFMAEQLMSHTVMKREFHMFENRVFINDGYVTFNIIELDREARKVTVNICNSWHHTIDTFELKDLDGWTYFEYGRPSPEKIYIFVEKTQKNNHYTQFAKMRGRKFLPSYLLIVTILLARLIY
ncbi:MAG: hypothetical protein NC131_04830 [Roseburia sp.]|nr:hypothetical protein [Roseburia sp.]